MHSMRPACLRYFRKCCTAPAIYVVAHGINADEHATTQTPTPLRTLTLFYRANAPALRARLKALVASVLQHTKHLVGASPTRQHTWDALGDCFPGLQRETLGSVSGEPVAIDQDSDDEETQAYYRISCMWLPLHVTSLITIYVFL